ncbi:MAG: DUF262 domain-containing protein [Magnetococcales bacterium]|nr:DUF262 domain-containing protein [Magnetococcales bacterium]
MQENQSLPEVKSEIVFISDLLQEVRRGRIRIPRFQRPFVWSREQIRELLDSIRQQFPIGSLLVWDTNTVLSSTSRIGTTTVISAPEGSTIAHVLDGQQRLTTLVGALLQPNEQDTDDEDPDRWKIWFDARANEFEHPKREETMEAFHFPMWKLNDTIDLLTECDRMRNAAQGDEGLGYVSRVQTLARTFQGYKLPLIRLQHSNLTQAVETFTRLNSRGRAMTADQMASALTYMEDPSGKPSFRFDVIIDRSLEQLDRYGFGDIDRRFVLRAHLANIDEEIYRTDWTRATAKGKRGEIRRKLSEVAVEESDQSLLRAVSFLMNMGVNCSRLLPYGMQLVVLSAFFSQRPDPTENQKSLLRRWFWVSSFAGWIASGNPSRISALVKEFRNEVAANDNPTHLKNMNLEEPAQAFPKRFDMRSARARTILLMLLNQKPRDSQGNLIADPWKNILSQGPSALGRIFSSGIDRDLAQGPANRILQVVDEERSQASKWLLALGKVDPPKREEILLSHAISVAAWEALKVNDRDRFLELRQEYLIELEQVVMKEERVVPPPTTEPQFSPTDTE